MPTVPVYGPPKAAQEPLPAPRITAVPSAEAFGAGEAAQGASAEARGLGIDILKVQEQERRKANSIAAIDAANQAAMLQDSILYDPKSGFLTRRGKNALETGVPEKVAADFDAGVKRLAGGLANEDQRFLFQQHVSKLYDDTNRTVQRHIFRESQAYTSETLTTRGKLLEDEVGRAYADPMAVEGLVEQRHAVDRDIANVNGWGGTVVKAMNLESGSAMRSQAIGLMLADGNYAGAKRYYDEHLDGFTTNDRIRMGSAIAGEEIKGRSQGLSDEIVAGMVGQGEAARPLTEGEAIDVMKAKASVENWKPALRDAVESRIQHHYQDQDRIQRKNVEAAYNGAAGALDAEETAAAKEGRTPRLPEDIIPAEVWNNPQLLPPDVKQALIRRHAPVVNDDKAWLDFITTDQRTLAGMSRGEFESKFWSRLDNAHREQASNHYRNALEATTNPKAAAAFQGVISDTDMVLRAVQRLGDGGIKPTDGMEDIKDSKTKVAALREFQDEVQARLGAYHAETGKNADDQVKQRIMDEMVQNKLRSATVRRALFGVDAMWPDSTKRISQLSDAEILEASPTEVVPQSFVNNVVNLTRSQGIALDLSRDSDKLRVGRAYIAALRGKNDLLKQILGVR